jgi:hypothetical protein
MCVAIDKGGHQDAALRVAPRDLDTRGRIARTNCCDATVEGVHVAALDDAEFAHGMSTAGTCTVRRITARSRLRKRENASVCEENLGRHAAIVADSGQSATVP